ncbi:MAG: hypothetical protein ABIA75_08590 [Candidatus Neomarinimicrobiota bacterium]
MTINQIVALVSLTISLAVYSGANLLDSSDSKQNIDIVYLTAVQADSGTNENE